MPVGEEQRQKLLQWFKEKKVIANCPSCGQSNWSLGEIVAAPSFVSGGIVIGGPAVPMVQLICSNCAYVRLHAAVPIGLVG